MLQDFVLETCNAPGTGSTLSLLGAPTGRRTFAQAFSSGVNAFYFMDDSTQAEWGIGVFTAGTPNTLTRATVIGNTSGTTSRLNFLGTTRVYNEAPASHVIYTDAGGNAAITGAMGALQFQTRPGALGSALLGGGDATHTGIVGFYDAAGTTRRGYIGFGTVGGWLVLVPENGTQGYSCTMAFQAQTSLYVGPAQTSPIASTTQGWVFNSNGSAASYSSGVTGVNLGIPANGTFIGFFNGSSTVVGSISVTSGVTAYNTTSDARLKIDLGPIEDSGDIIDLLRPIDYRWKSDPTTENYLQGFLAQEVAAALPNAHTPGHGEPGDEGFVPDQVDLSKMVPHIVAELKALRARVKHLESKR